MEVFVASFWCFTSFAGSFGVRCFTGGELVGFAGLTIVVEWAAEEVEWGDV